MAIFSNIKNGSYYGSDSPRDYAYFAAGNYSASFRLVENIIGYGGNQTVSLLGGVLATIDLGAGDADTVILATGGNTSRLILTGVEYVYGTAGSQQLNWANGGTVSTDGSLDRIYCAGSFANNITYTASTGDNFLDLGGGDDTVTVESGLTGTDTIIGGGGHDTLYLGSSTTLASDVNIPGFEHIILTNSGTTLTITSWTSAATITGTTGNDTINGGTGADSIFGDAGNDVITGGGGADSINAGDGDDVLKFANAATLVAAAIVNGGEAVEVNGDTIYFTSADTIVDANFASGVTAPSIENIRLTGASTLTIGANATTAGISRVYSGSGATSITKTDTVALSVDATDLADDTTLTIDDSVVTTNFTVSALTGDLSATALAGTLQVALGNNTSDSTISIALGAGNVSLTGGSSTDTVTIAGLDVVQSIDMSGSASNHAITTGSDAQTIIGGTGVDAITTGSDVDRVEFHAGSARANISTSGTDGEVAARISSISSYNLDHIDFVGTEAIGASLDYANVDTNASGVVTFTGVADTLGAKIAAVRSALDTTQTDKVVIIHYGEDSYAYDSGTTAANDDQIVRIVGDNALNTITLGGSIVLDAVMPVQTLTTFTSLLPAPDTWTGSGASYSAPTHFTAGAGGNSLLTGGGGVGGFGTAMGTGDDFSTIATNLTDVFPTGLNMFGISYTNLYMGSNGYVTFGSGFSGYSPSGIPGFTRSPMIAAQYDDLYIGAGARNVTAGSGASGTSTGNSNMYYYEDNSRMVFTWNNVGLYSNGVSNNTHSGAADYGSAFQIILHKLAGGDVAATDFGIEVRYEEIALQNASASAGWTAGDTKNYGTIQPGSLQNAVGTSNIGINGVWAWEVTGGKVSSVVNLPDVGLTTAKDVSTIAVTWVTAGLVATSYTMGGEAASQFTAAITGTNQAKISTVANAQFNLWKDAYVDNVATVTVRPYTADSTPGWVDTINVALSDNNGAGGPDPVTRTAGSAILLVTATSTALNTATDGELVSATPPAGWTAITTVTVNTASAVDLDLHLQSENLILIGNNGNDTLTGGAGNNTITGGAGADSMNGGNGNNVYIVAAAAHHTTDTITGGSGNDTIRFTSSAGAETLTLNANNTDAGTLFVAISDADGATTGTTALNVNADLLDANQAVSITGNNGANTLTGNGDGANTIDGGAGADIITGGSIVDSIVGGTGEDSITGGLGADIITGGADNDTITMLVTSGNTDTIDAGTDNVDTLVLTGAAAGNIVVDLSSATQQFTDGGTDTLTQAGFENVNAIAVTANKVDVTTIAATTAVGLGTVTGATISGAATTIAIDASTLADGASVTLSGVSMIPTVTGLVGDLTATDVTGALSITTGNAAGNTIAIVTGTAATTVNTAAGAASDTVSIDAVALAQNIALTITSGAAAAGTVNVSNLVGNLVVSNPTTGTIGVALGNAADNGIAITAGTSNLAVTGAADGDTVTVTGLQGNFTGAVATATGIFNVTTSGTTTQTIATGVGNDIITTGGSAMVTITGGDGDDVITLGSSAQDKVVIADTAANNGVDTITGFVSLTDKIDINAFGTAVAFTATGSAVAVTTAANKVLLYTGATAGLADVSNAALITYLNNNSQQTDAAATMYAVVVDDNSTGIYEIVGNNGGDEFTGDTITLVATIATVCVSGDFLFA